MNNNTYPEYPDGGKRVSGGQRSVGQPTGGRRRRRKRKQSRALYYVILVILLGVLVFSAVKIISYFKQQADASNAQDEINNNYVTPGNSDSNDNMMEIRPIRRPRIRIPRPSMSILAICAQTIPMW